MKVSYYHFYCKKNHNKIIIKNIPVKTRHLYRKMSSHVRNETLRQNVNKNYASQGFRQGSDAIFQSLNVQSWQQYNQRFRINCSRQQNHIKIQAITNKL